MSSLFLQKIFCCCSVAKSCLTLCDPMNRSISGLPVHHQLPEFTQTHVHWVDDAIQPSHPLLSPSTSAFNRSQHQGLFQWVVLHIRWPKYWNFSFSISPSNEYSGLTSFRIDWFSLQSKGLSRVFSNTTFKSINSSALSFLYSPTHTSIHDYWENLSFDKMDLCWQINVSDFKYAV